VTNKEAGRKLLDTAEKLLRRDARAALADGDYNIAVRRAQEAVELALKGGLRILGADYPKVHDVGQAFVEQAARRQVDLDQATLSRINTASRWLAEARAPSFYFERDYDAADAERAIADATFVVSAVRRLVQPEDEN